MESLSVTNGDQVGVHFQMVHQKPTGGMSKEVSQGKGEQKSRLALTGRPFKSTLDQDDLLFPIAAN